PAAAWCCRCRWTGRSGPRSSRTTSRGSRRWPRCSSNGWTRMASASSRNRSAPASQRATHPSVNPRPATVPARVCWRPTSRTCRRTAAGTISTSWKPLRCRRWTTWSAGGKSPGWTGRAGSMSNPLPQGKGAAPYADRDVRQRDLVPPDRLARCHAVVVGVGAIGRQAALQLAAMGVPRLTFVDHDYVGVENLAVQGYAPHELGLAKVEAAAAACRLLNPDLAVTADAHRFRRSSVGELAALKELLPDLDVVVFCCVDDVAARRLVWESTRDRIGFFADGRMAAEVLRVLVSTDPFADDRYAKTLFSPEQ